MVHIARLWEKKKSIHSQTGKEEFLCREHLLRNGKKKNYALTTNPANEKVGGEHGNREKKGQIFVKMKNLPFLSLWMLWKSHSFFAVSLCTLRSVLQGRKLKQLSKSKNPHVRIHTKQGSIWWTVSLWFSRKLVFSVWFN